MSFAAQGARQHASQDAFCRLSLPLGRLFLRVQLLIMAESYLIETPMDFEVTLNCHSYDKIVLSPPDTSVEPRLRHALDQIFSEDLLCLDSSEPDLVSSYLDSIEKPLRMINELSYSLFAILDVGSLNLPDDMEIPHWRRATYFIVPRNGFFRIGKSISTRSIHRFDPECGEAISSILDAMHEGATIVTFANRDSVVVNYERNVPWCPECCIDEMLGNST